MKKKVFGETDGIRAKANEYPLDAISVVKIGRALAEFTKKYALPNPNRDFKVIIGKDTRRSGYLIEQALTAGILSRGVDVMTVGPIPTPAISRLVQSFALDLGIMITASHNPFHDNGIKVFTSEGIKLNDEQELEVEKYFFTEELAEVKKIGRAKRIEDVSGRYVEYVKSVIPEISLNGYTIVVDCANGASYKTAPIIFKELGAKVIEIGVSPDGYNINMNCGSLHPEHLAMTVKENKANFGVALDGDADRAIFVDEQGNIIDGDYIMALVAKYLKSKGRLNNDTIVSTQYSNLALSEYLRTQGINTLNVINGDKEVAALLDQQKLNFGGEFNGHFIFKDYSDVGDGTMAALIVAKILIESGRPFSEIANLFVKYPRSLEAFDVTERKPINEIPELSEFIDTYNTHNQGLGRILVRYSGTENKIRVLIEAKEIAEVEKQTTKMKGLIKKYLL